MEKNRNILALIAAGFLLVFSAIYGETPAGRRTGQEDVLYEGIRRVCREAPGLFLPILLETLELFPVLATDEHRTPQEITDADPLHLAEEVRLLGKSLPDACPNQLASSAYRMLEILHGIGRQEEFREDILSDALRALPFTMVLRRATESWHGLRNRQAYYWGVIGANLFPKHALFWNIRCSFLYSESFSHGSYPASVKFRWVMAQALRHHPADASLWFTRGRWNWWLDAPASLEDLRQSFRANPQDHLVPFWLAQKEREFGIPASYPEQILTGVANDDRALKSWLERIEP